jgi:hypothetical protein
MMFGIYRSREKRLPFLMLNVIVLMEFLKLAYCDRKLTSWRGPNSFILGVPPTPRDCHGLATILGNLYVFGGNSGTSGIILHAHI